MYVIHYDEVTIDYLATVGDGQSFRGCSCNEKQMSIKWRISVMQIT